MPYLVDGNNVMAQRVGWHRDKSGARWLLLRDLAFFAAAKKNEIRVVFDGAPEPDLKDGAIHEGIRVWYAERGSNADERIKSLVEQEPQRQTLIVVTSDRALGDYVGRFGATVMRSGEFRKKLDALRKAPEKAPGELPKVDEPEQGWMRYFGTDEDEDQPASQRPVRPTGRKRR
jgi:predicted RNA-binding protein with PIN domain